MSMSRGAFLSHVAIARARGFGRMPRQAEPLAQQRRYAKRIKERVLESAMALVRELLIPHLEGLAAIPSILAKDAAKADDLGDIIDEISNRYWDQWTRREFSKIVRPVADEVAHFEAVQLNKQLSAAIGERVAIDIVGDEPWLQRAIEEFTRENVALIRTIPEQFFSDLEKSLAREISDGARWEELADLVESRYSVSESRAELIARDQVGKFNGDLARVRQTDLGISKFVWRTMGDERVRDEHIDRNGVTYEWSDPPDGETPGEPIQCRCFAEPDVASALGG